MRACASGTRQRNVPGLILDAGEPAAYGRESGQVEAALVGSATKNRRPSRWPSMAPRARDPGSRFDSTSARESHPVGVSRIRVAVKLQSILIAAQRAGLAAGAVMALVRGSASTQIRITAATPVIAMNIPSKPVVSCSNATIGIAAAATLKLRTNLIA